MVLSISDIIPTICYSHELAHFYFLCEFLCLEVLIMYILLLLDLFYDNLDCAFYHKIIKSILFITEDSPELLLHLCYILFLSFKQFFNEI